MTRNRSTPLRALLGATPVIPVLVIDDAATAVPLARALAEGGLRVLEITLRTPAALASIAEIKKTLPDIMVGAGTVRNPGDARLARDAGARFVVSPGHSLALGDACSELGLPYLPGVATASEVMAALEQGYDLLKFFPAEAAGGISMLKALAGPFADAAFCPTGGVDVTNAQAYLSLPNVHCVGGSWIAPRPLVVAARWAAVTELAAAAAALRRGGQSA